MLCLNLSLSVMTEPEAIKTTEVLAVSPVSILNLKKYFKVVVQQCGQSHISEVIQVCLS